MALHAAKHTGKTVVFFSLEMSREQLAMIEEGITQAASLQLGAVCGSLVSSIGHAYFSPNRLQSDISDFHRLIHPKDGYVQVPDGPGLGVTPDWGAIKIYTVATEIITASNHI